MVATYLRAAIHQNRSDRRIGDSAIHRGGGGACGCRCDCNAQHVEVPLAVEKATKQSNRTQMSVPVVGTTIPHQVLGTYRASRVLLLPAKPGTGVIAGHCVRSVVEAAGITDILTKAYGSTNPLNLVKATLDALKKLRTREQIERLRGVSL